LKKKINWCYVSNGEWFVRNPGELPPMRARTGQPLPYNKNVCYRPPNEIVKTDNSSTCPRCGSTDVAWCGGDSDGSNYYHMYLCEDCGRLPKGVRVFLVPCSKEEYGHNPLALPRDPDVVTSMAFREMDFGEDIVPSISRVETDFEKKDETAFPESDVANFGRYGDHGVYDKDEVDGWFKRCVADYPEFTHFPSNNEGS